MRKRRVVGRRSRRSGAALVEMAAVLPVLLTLVLGVIDTARLGSVAQRLQNAAREGCRVAAMPDSTQAGVQARVQAVLSDSGLPIGQVAPSPSGWATSARGAAITVTLTIPYSQVSWLGQASLFRGAMVHAEATMGSER